MIHPPKFEELNGYYRSYWNYLDEDDLLSALKKQTDVTKKMLDGIPAAKETFAYAPGKWTIRELAGHLSDTERILSYRALRFARNDQTALPGFDENEFVRNSHFSSRPLPSIVAEWRAGRESTITLFSGLHKDSLDITGIANGNPVTPRGILYFILVHERHHLKVLKENYLVLL